MQDVLGKPVPIVFAVCQGWQELRNGTFNLLGMFDKMMLRRLPDGSLPNRVALPIFSTWTGGVGDFEQVITILNQDGSVILSHPTKFHLTSTSHRHNIVAQLAFAPVEGAITITIGRPDQELLRQDFTFEVEAAPPAK
jgi:hypothetical protein